MPIHASTCSGSRYSFNEQIIQKPCSTYHIKVTSYDTCDDCLCVAKVALVSAALTPVVIPIVGAAIAAAAGVGVVMLGAGVVILGGIGTVVVGTIVAMTAAVVCTAAVPLLIAGAIISTVL